MSHVPDPRLPEIDSSVTPFACPRANAAQVWLRDLPVHLDVSAAHGRHVKSSVRNFSRPVHRKLLPVLDSWIAGDPSCTMPIGRLHRPGLERRRCSVHNVVACTIPRCCCWGWWWKEKRGALTEITATCSCNPSTCIWTGGPNNASRGGGNGTEPVTDPTQAMVLLRTLRMDSAKRPGNPWRLF